MNTLKIKESFLSDGSLLLINRHYPLKKDNSQMVVVPPLLDFPEIRMEIRAAACLNQLLAAWNDSVEIIPVSGFRTPEEQSALRALALQDHGKQYADRYVAFPGSSEHETGLAVDLAKKSDYIDPICPEFPQTENFSCFCHMAGQYGFIRRYTAEKEHITGIGSEPWHFRYVGYPHSDLMNSLNLCLEEYIGYLRRFTQRKPLILLRGGRKICIFCAEAGQTVSLESGEVAEISGTNAGECVVTVWR